MLDLRRGYKSNLGRFVSGSQMAKICR